ncbi:MAG: hypothetical protein AB7P00_27525 [Sandaracinaceae bacterium]
MRMRAGIMRIGRIAVIAVAAYLAFRWLEPQGRGWWVLVGAAIGTIIWIGIRAYRARKLRAEEERIDRFANALMTPSDRPAAIEELRAAIGSAKSAEERAQLRLSLAELLEADGDAAGALEALAPIERGSIGKRTTVIVAHARAVAHLSRGDADAAADALDDDAAPTGDRATDLRVKMMRGLIAAERGRFEEALEIAEHARDEAGSDADLKTEARIVRAMALDVRGEREAALRGMHAIGEEMLSVLAVLGLPRVRELAQSALDERDESPEPTA